MSAATIPLPFQPASMSTAQHAAVTVLARYSGRTHHLHSSSLREWFARCEGNGLGRRVRAIGRNSSADGPLRPSVLLAFIL